ncbi:hypothetical protein FOA24_21910 [Bacillus thuringiensis]|uniref:hypothetical protein n=1 Tax=Bacillus thuringiensis TaxID=1428 RepID=UPI00333C11AB
MIKNRMKKTIRKTVVGFALLAGIVTGGVNPASADTLKDSNGNSIVAGHKYYMEPYEFPGQGLAYEEWSGDLWAKLGSTPDQTVTIEQSGNSVRLKTDKQGLINESTWGPIVPVNIYLGIHPTTDGVALVYNLYPSNEQWWIPTEPTEDMNPDVAARNYFAFKNYYSHKFMSVGDSGGWLTTNKSTMDSKTMWRLVPKQ